MKIKNTNLISGYNFREPVIYKNDGLCDLVARILERNGIRDIYDLTSITKEVVETPKDNSINSLIKIDNFGKPASKNTYSFSVNIQDLQDINNDIKFIAKDIFFKGKEIETRTLIYHSIKAGIDWHWDKNFNFVCQLSGKKTWSYSNKEIPLLGSEYSSAYGRSNKAYLEESARSIAMPKAELLNGPKEFVTKNLCKGDVLVLPPGIWHKTYAEGKSLSLNFTIGFEK